MKGPHKIDDSLDQVPPGLEYKEEYWDSALTMIEAHETKVAWLKVLGGISAAAVIVFASVFWSFKTEASELAFDHSTEQLALNAKVETVRINPFESRNESANQSTSTPASNVVAGNTSMVNFESGSESATAQQNGVGLTSALGSADKTLGSADKTLGRADETMGSSAETLGGADETGVADAQVGSEQGSAEESVADTESGSAQANADDAADNEYVVNELPVDDSSLRNESSVADHDENSQESAGSNNDQNFASTDEGITLSTDGPKSIIPISAETLNIATQTTLSSEMNALSNSSVSEWIPVDQSELISMNGLDGHVFENVLDYSPMSGIASRKPVYVPPMRKKLNIQLIAGYNMVTDYDDDFWGLHDPKMDEEFGDELGNQISANSRQESRIMVGMGIDYTLKNSRWSLNSNVHYFSASGLNFGHKIEDCWIGLSGEECATRYMQTTKLHMVSVPLNIAMRIGPKFQVSTGVGTEFIVQNDYVIERFYFDDEEIDLAMAASLGDKVVREVRAEKGYLEAFSRVNYFANANINYCLTEGITIGVAYQYGLSDITRNLLVAQTFDRNNRMYGYVRFRVW